MEKISLRLYVLLCTAIMWLQSWAQGNVENDDMTGRRQIDSSEESIDDLLEYQQIDINISDVITILLVILACYVFGKIWRGCSYLIIVIAAIFYYLAR
ncbi:hypothetical protein [Prevotella sp. E13-27]|uniref:hypothetical protein n=1 Tax=Prevotella sp. E13-27 TaxID=2938122 RepID=UPI00200AF4AC|nr:hypothetical protein [Prevotella sp. E13-27]MCK8621716.1 hypothetical protein [Prevotella sp. E13-27]